jgi:hypothetical protein
LELRGVLQPSGLGSAAQLFDWESGVADRCRARLKTPCWASLQVVSELPLWAGGGLPSDLLLALAFSFFTTPQRSSTVL